MQNNKKAGIILWLVLAVYMLILLKITVFRSGFLDVDFFSGRLHFMPAASYVKLLQNHRYAFALYQLGGNIGWFIPFGFLLPFLRGKPVKLHWVILFGFLLSLVIELSQFVFGTGESETDDLLLNTAGALIGFLIYRGYIHIKNNRKA